MRPSGSVTAAAIVALLGSAFVAFFGLIDLLIVGLMSRIGPEVGTLSKQSATILTVGIVGGSLFSFAFAGWGLPTGIGLLRLKPWSRISILIYSGFLAALMLFLALSFVLAPLPETLNGDQEFEHIFRIMRLFWLAPLGIVVWWLVLFTRRSVAAQFSGVSQPIVPQQVQFDAGPAIVPRSPPRSQRPIFFTILAWYFVASAPALFLMYGFFKRIPIPIFGFLIGGHFVVIYLLAVYAAMLASGIALLKNKAWRFWLAFAIQVFHLLNVGGTFSLAGGVGRFEKYLAAAEEMAIAGLPTPASHPLHMGMMITIGLVIGGLFPITILILLWTCRKRFFEFVVTQTR